MSYGLRLAIQLSLVAKMMNLDVSFGSNQRIMTAGTKAVGSETIFNLGDVDQSIIFDGEGNLEEYGSHFWL